MAESVLDKLIKIDLNPQLRGNYRINPAEELSMIEHGQNMEMRFDPLDISKIDKEGMVRKCIRMEDLEPYLKAMSYRHKSHEMIEMYPEMKPDGMRIPTKASVSL